jgi:hypothetical protein
MSGILLSFDDDMSSAREKILTRWKRVFRNVS